MQTKAGTVTLKQCDFDKKTQAKTMNTLVLNTMDKRVVRYDICDACLPELARLAGRGEALQQWLGGKPK